MELYEQIRREYEHGAGTVRAVARKLGVHRREVRKALASAMPAVLVKYLCARRSKSEYHVRSKGGV